MDSFLKWGNLCSSGNVELKSISEGGVVFSIRAVFFPAETIFVSFIGYDGDNNRY